MSHLAAEKKKLIKPCDAYNNARTISELLKTEFNTTKSNNYYDTENRNMLDVQTAVL